MGDLDLGYRMRGAIFGQGAFLVSDHDTESLASADAPVSSIYSSGRPPRWLWGVCCEADTYGLCGRGATNVTVGSI